MSQKTLEIEIEEKKELYSYQKGDIEIRITLTRGHKRDETSKVA